MLRVDEATGKISLGLKQLQNDPWATVASGYEVGQVRTGRVTRVAEFGAFVELEPGIEALAHASTFPPTGRAGGWAKQVPVGTTGAFEILTVNPAQKRIGVAMVEAGTARAAPPSGHPGQSSPGHCHRQGRAAREVRRLRLPGAGQDRPHPGAETGLDRDADLHKAFPIGSEVEVVVLEVDPAGRRIRLSKKAVAEQREKAELRDYEERQRQDASPSQSLGSLADKLRGALGSR